MTTTFKNLKNLLLFFFVAFGRKSIHNFRSIFEVLFEDNEIQKLVTACWKEYSLKYRYVVMQGECIYCTRLRHYVYVHS